MVAKGTVPTPAWVRGEAVRFYHNPLKKSQFKNEGLFTFSIDIFGLHVPGSSGSETESEREGAGLGGAGRGY